MLPSPEQASSENAQIPVADPDKAKHPEDASSSLSSAAHRPEADPASSSVTHQSCTAAATSGSAGKQEQQSGVLPDDLSSAAAATAPASELSHEQAGAAAAEQDVQKLWRKQPILLDVQKECFSRLLLLPEILVDHLPDTYLAAVQRL